MNTLHHITIKPFFIFFNILLWGVFCEEATISDATGEDSYVEAYKKIRSESVKLIEDSVRKTDREFQVNPNDAYPYPTQQPQYGPPMNYGASAPQYAPYPNPPAYGPPAPPPAYGPPSPPPAYGPPSPPPAYGPPSPPPAYGPPYPPPSYGTPAPLPAYGPPVYNSPSSVQVFYGVPHALGSIWDKLKLKLSIFTLGKILLKLVIFKKIVSWIAVLCLLLFIPSLKHKVEASNGSNDEEIRGWGKFSDETVNNMTDFILRAVHNTSFEEKQKNSR